MAELTVHDIARSERVRAITDNFFFWQGLRFVPLGPVMILATIAASLPIVHLLAVKVLLIAAMIGAMMVSANLGKRYRREFGSVSPIPGAHRTRSRAKWLIVYPIMFGSLAFDLLRPLPILVSGFVWAGAILLYRRSTGGGREHYFVLAAMIAALTPAPLVAEVTSKAVAYVMLMLLGAGYCVCGWLDDREMRRVLKAA